MAIERRLATWVEAGLIDSATAERIRTHESAHARPVLALAVAGLGLFALALGLMLIVAANWDRIAAPVKLGAHLALLAAALATAWWARARNRPFVAEGALFLAAALVLAGIALQAQVYQLTGPAWEALLLWLALAGPMLLLAGRTRLAGTLFAAMALIGPAAMAADTVDRGGLWRLAQGAAMAVPILLIALGAGAPRLAPGFRKALLDAGIVAALAAASIAHFAWASRITPAQALDNGVRFLVPALAAALALIAVRRADGLLPRLLVLPLLVAPLVAGALALAIPHPDATASRIVGFLLFLALWGLVARGAALAGWQTLFAIAVAAAAIRLFIVYIELFGSLASTGGGLVAGGLLMVGLAFGWQRLVRRQKAHAP
ncbi:MAG: DUF2157 domain-containing protein [Sphingomonadaceae bacterium]